MSRRTFAMVEPYMWVDPQVRALPESARWMWFHLLTSPRATRLPGLLKASPLVVMADLSWDRAPEGGLRWSESEILSRGIERTLSALTALENTQHQRTGIPWVVVDRTDNLIVLPRRVAHQLPANANIVKGWLTELREIPPSMGRDTWIVHAHTSLREAFGREDDRVKLLGEISRGIKLPQEQSSQEDNSEKGNGLQNSSETVPETTPEPFRKDLDPDLDIDPDKNRGGGRRSTPTSQRPLLQDETEPPRGASERLKRIYIAMQTVTFNVPGKGEETLWANAKRPREIAQRLDQTFPGVDIAQLIMNLAGWTITNPTRAKRDLAKFVWNAASRDQDKPRSRPQQQPTEEYRHGTDLADKVKRTRRSET